MNTVIASKGTPGYALGSDKQHILLLVKAEVGAKQVTATSLSFAPPWILNDARHDEITENWKKAYTKIPVHRLHLDANVNKLARIVQI